MVRHVDKGYFWYFFFLPFFMNIIHISHISDGSNFSRLSRMGTFWLAFASFCDFFEHVWVFSLQLTQEYPLDFEEWTQVDICCIKKEWVSYSFTVALCGLGRAASTRSTRGIFPTCVVKIQFSDSQTVSVTAAVTQQPIAPIFTFKVCFVLEFCCLEPNQIFLFLCGARRLRFSTHGLNCMPFDVGLTCLLLYILWLNQTLCIL